MYLCVFYENLLIVGKMLTKIKKADRTKRSVSFKNYNLVVYLSAIHPAPDLSLPHS